MRVLKFAVCLFVVSSLVACGKDKKSGEAGPSGGGDGSSGVLSVTSEVEVPAIITADQIKITQADENVEEKTDASGNGIACRATVKEGVVDYIIEGNKLVISQDGQDHALEYVSGNPADVFGEWKFLEESDGDFNVKGFMIVKDASVVVRSVCSKQL